MDGGEATLRSVGDLLTPRELDVLMLVVKGMSNRDAGRKLGITHSTVANHVASIMEKLRAKSRTQAATEAVRRGIVDLRD